MNGEFIMHRLNTSYGNKAILASHCGIEGDLPIWGNLQHGWQPLPYINSDFSRFGRQTDKFIWSSSLLAGHEHFPNVGKYVVVGSPFAYLLQDNPILKPKIGSGTIAFPFHSAPGEPVANRHHRYSQELIDTEGKPIDVCLYWSEFQDASVRNSYEVLGHNVVTVGSSRNNRQFLPNLLRLLDGKNRAVSNSMSTILTFTASVGFETEIYGDGMAASEIQELFQRASRERLLTEQELNSDRLIVSETWAKKELGWNETLPPDVLAHTVGWTGLKRKFGVLFNSPVELLRSSSHF